MKNEASTLTVNKKKLVKLLLKYEENISRGSTDIGCSKLVTNRIDTGDTISIRMGPRRILYFQHEVQQNISATEAAGIVRKSTSPWAFQIMVVCKKDGTARICVVYSRIIDVTKKDAHQLPKIDDVFNALRSAKFFSILDFASGYFQVLADKIDQEMTGFVTPWGHYEYTVMLF